MKVHLVFWIGTMLPSALSALIGSIGPSKEQVEGVNYFKKVQMSIWADLESGNVTAKFRDVLESKSELENGRADSCMKSIEKAFPEEVVVESHRSTLGSKKVEGDGLNKELKQALEPLSNSFRQNGSDTFCNPLSRETVTHHKFVQINSVNETSPRKSTTRMNHTNHEPCKGRNVSHSTHPNVNVSDNLATMSPYVSELLMNGNESPLNTSAFTLSPNLLKYVPNDTTTMSERPPKSRKKTTTEKCLSSPKPTKGGLSPVARNSTTTEGKKCQSSSTKKPDSKLRLPLLFGTTAGSSTGSASLSTTKTPAHRAKVGRPTSGNSDGPGKPGPLPQPQMEKEFLTENTSGPPTKKSTITFPDDEDTAVATVGSRVESSTSTDDSWTGEISTGLSVSTDSAKNVETTSES